MYLVNLQYDLWRRTNKRYVDSSGDDFSGSDNEEFDLPQQSGEKRVFDEISNSTSEADDDSESETLKVMELVRHLVIQQVRIVTWTNL